ncbi:hypothetical protein BH09ACT7_BH09ACT7_53920 [soil metagenome]
MAGRFPVVSEDRVRVQTNASGVATVTMVRADKHNALDQAMFEGLVNAAEQLAGDTSVRAVVLHGDGKSFCSGLDVASFMSGQGGTGVLLRRDSDRLANFAQRVTYDWSLVPAPVIAAIHGNCFGGGLQIALGADIRIAAPDAKLSIMEIKWGLVPDMGITQTLPRLLPIDVAKELRSPAASSPGALRGPSDWSLETATIRWLRRWRSQKRSRRSLLTPSRRPSASTTRPGLVTTPQEL